MMPTPTELLQEICNKRQNPLLSLLLPNIDRKGLLLIQKKIKQISGERIDVMLSTPGGSPDIAYKMIKLLRSHFKEVNFIIPYYAKSAGTLMCLGGDNIYMTEIAELGPLDTQIQEMQEGNHPIYKSALEGFKALEQIQVHTLETLDITVKLIIQSGGLKIGDAFNLAAQFTGQTSGILYKQLDPMRIGAYARALEIGERYGIIILHRYMKREKERAELTIRTLVKKYPSHGFVIDMEEFESLGLPAQTMPKEILDATLACIPFISAGLSGEEAKIDFLSPIIPPKAVAISKKGKPTAPKKKQK